MNAIAVHYGTVEAAVMAVEAGADLVLISHTAKLQEAAFEALEAGVKNGRISENALMNPLPACSCTRRSMDCSR